MKHNTIRIIDETIREGMQYQGVMFSPEQRRQILQFQEQLGVDISQAGYPAAHPSEITAIEQLLDHARQNHWQIRIAAMGRADIQHADLLLATAVRDLHFHVHIQPDTGPDQIDRHLEQMAGLIRHIREHDSRAVVSIAMLDISRFDTGVLCTCAAVLEREGLDILSVPDTSGVLSPNQICEKIKVLSHTVSKLQLSIHCHNDMGMASANGVMGILAGGGILEASVLGIGERNGITDLYTAAKLLKDQGFNIRLNTDDTDTFHAYYAYVDAIVHEQTGQHLLTCNTPAFGTGVRTHVAGTHAGGDFGRHPQTAYCLNVLCGQHLVRQFLCHHGISFSNDQIPGLTAAVKNESVRLNRRIGPKDIRRLL